MKTIDDALDKYDCKWPEGATHIAWCGSDDALFPCVGAVLDGRRWKNICTRKEFEEAAEKRKAEQVKYKRGQQIEYLEHESGRWWSGVYIMRHKASCGTEINLIECDEADPNTPPFDGVPDACIRPLKTERERFIEAGLKAAGEFEAECDVGFLGAMFDSDKFKLVNE